MDTDDEGMLSWSEPTPDGGLMHYSVPTDANGNAIDERARGAAIREQRAMDNPDQPLKMTYDEWSSMMQAEQAFGPPDPYANQGQQQALGGDNGMIAPGQNYQQPQPAPQGSNPGLGFMEMLMGLMGGQGGGGLGEMLSGLTTPEQPQSYPGIQGQAQQQTLPSADELGRLLTETLLRPGEFFPTPVAEQVPLGSGTLEEGKNALQNRQTQLDDAERRNQ